MNDEMLKESTDEKTSIATVSRVEQIVLPAVLDVCCGPRNFWFNQTDERALFVEKRHETHILNYPSGNYTEIIDPDIQADFTALPFPDNSFAMVVFDPPHIVRKEALGRITKKYGILNGEWKEMLRRGFQECFRVLKPEGTLIFKWNECNIPVKDILELTTEKPLFGHKSGKLSQTHWIAFIKAKKAKA